MTGHLTAAPRRAASDLGWNLAWAVGYLLVVLASNRSNSAVESGPELFWPASGIALAWLLLARGPRLAWASGLFVAVTLVVQASDLMVTTSVLLLTPAHIGLVLLARWLVRRSTAGPTSDGDLRPDLTCTGDLLAFGRAAVVAALVTAPLAAAAAAVYSGVWDPWVWMVWVARNCVSMIVAGGTILLVAQLLRRMAAGQSLRTLLVPAPRPRIGRELAAATVASGVLTYVVFGIEGGLPISFAITSITVWTGLRFTPVVVATFSLVISGVGAFATGAGLGAFADVADPLARSVTMQVFVALTAAAGLLLSTGALGQHHLTQRLAEATARFDGLLARLDDYIWSADLRDDGTSVLTFASATVTSVLGGEAPRPGEPDVFGALGRQVVPEDLPLLAAFRQELLDDGVAETELRVLGHDGIVRWAWTRASARRVGDRLVLEGITTDITERKALDELRNQFLAIAGHELRTPLTVIRGYAETLGERVADDVAASQQAAAIGRRAEQLEALVGDFFDLATFENGRVSLDHTPVGLAGLLVDAADDHAPAAAEVGITLTHEVEPVTVWADVMRIRQVVDNLVDNAIKYGREGGTVTVTCRAVGARAVLSVADDGIGVPAEEMPHVFERFFRASTGRQQTVFGTGLGLAVVKAVDRGPRGHACTARLAPGGGLVITVDLPAFTDAPPLPPFVTDVEPAGSDHGSTERVS